MVIKLPILSFKNDEEARRRAYLLSGIGEANHLTTSP